MKKVLITGANSYIGESVKNYLLQESDKYSIDIKDTIDWEPKIDDFIGYNIVFNVAGIVHVKETLDNKQLYYDINRDFVVKIATAAKAGGVGLFILLSTMSVYGLSIGHIMKESPVNPVNSYGKSKAEADAIIKELEDENFKFACLRPPMVYGKGCKGNYQSLRSFALKSPIFPSYHNQRSMIYIGNLCEFVKEIIDQEKKGLFFPQNDEYISTSEMVRMIANAHDKKMRLTKVFNWAIKIAPIKVIKKVFGNLTYEKVDAVNKYGFEESIKLTEGINQ